MILLVSYGLTAIVVTTTGRITAEILTIDKAGVTVKAKLGTTLFKAADVKYILLDESRTDLEGRAGMLLKNGVWFYGEPSRISKSEGYIQNEYGLLQTTLDNIIYFSYQKDPTLELFLKRTEKEHVPTILLSSTGKTIVYLANGSTMSVKEFKIIEESGVFKYSFKDEIATYILNGNFVWKVEVERNAARGYNYVIETIKGTYIIGKPKFNNDLIIIDIPYDNRILLKISDVAKLFDINELYFGNDQVLLFSSNQIILTNQQMLIDNSKPPFNAVVSYDANSKTLIVNILAERLMFEGREMKEIYFDVPNK